MSDQLKSARQKLPTVCDSPRALMAFPQFLRRPPELRIGFLRSAFFWLTQVPVRLFIWAVLRPRAENPGKLDPDEVERVYKRQAKSYDSVHHFTTRGQDLMWRREAGWVVYNQCAQRVLDLCTGTGLTIQEVLNVSEATGQQVNIVGVDYSHDMLNRACARFAVPLGIQRESISRSTVSLVRGDATALVGKSDEQMTRFESDSFDAVTQVFGIGGIDKPMNVFHEVLKVLRSGGVYVMTDMHQPIPQLSGEWPCLGSWVRTPNLEMYTYLHTTVPLALERLWAWRDTTLCFYLAPLACVHENGRYWGFQIQYRSVTPERWWFALPVMPIGRLVLTKVEITEAAYAEQQKLLLSLGV